jgi:hypothetical protein
VLEHAGPELGEATADRSIDRRRALGREDESFLVTAGVVTAVPREQRDTAGLEHASNFA